MTKLKKVREEQGITQKQLSEKSGVNLRTIQNLEQGYKNINHASVSKVIKIAIALHCSIMDILETE